MPLIKAAIISKNGAEIIPAYWIALGTAVAEGPSAHATFILIYKLIILLNIISFFTKIFIILKKKYLKWK